MSYVYKTLKEKYFPIGQEIHVPDLVGPIGEKVEEVVQPEQVEEPFGFGNLSNVVKLPSDCYWAPDRPAPRPKFHVAAKNHPIPEPPSMRCHPSQNHKNHILPQSHRPKPTEEEIAKKRTEMENCMAVEEVMDLDYRTKMNYEKVMRLVQRIDEQSNEIQTEEDRLEQWKRKYAILQKKQNKIKKKTQEVKAFAGDVLKQPNEIRDENRKLRLHLTSVEATLVKRKEELRKLRLSDGEGAFLIELRQLKTVNKQLEEQITEFANKRGGLHNIMQTVSNGLSDQIVGLIHTNESLFSTTRPVFYDDEEEEDKNASPPPPLTYHNNATQPQLQQHQPEYNNATQPQQPEYNNAIQPQLQQLQQPEYNNAPQPKYNNGNSDDDDDEDDYETETLFSRQNINEAAPTNNINNNNYRSAPTKDNNNNGNHPAANNRYPMFDYDYNGNRVMPGQLPYSPPVRGPTTAHAPVPAVADPPPPRHCFEENDSAAIWIEKARNRRMQIEEQVKELGPSNDDLRELILSGPKQPPAELSYNNNANAGYQDDHLQYEMMMMNPVEKQIQEDENENNNTLPYQYYHDPKTYFEAHAL